MTNNQQVVDSQLVDNQLLTTKPEYQGVFKPRYRLILTGLGGVALFWVSWRYGSAEMARWSLLPGAIIATAGLMMRIWATGWLHKNEVLATQGPYALSRNPLYLGTFGITLGHSLMSAVPLAPIIFPIFFLVLYWPIMREEEEYLASRYGAEYAAYKARVPLLIPRPWTRGGSADASANNFSWPRIRRCWKGFLANSLVIVIYILFNSAR